MEKKVSDRADYKKVVYHLQIIHTWAVVDQKFGGINPDGCKDIVKWIDEALELMKEQEAVKPMAGGLCGVGGWISVKDRLPKKFGEPCIVYNGCSVQYGDYYSDGIWYTPDCYESEEIRDVTHWMPLPEPPKEENSGNEQHMS